MYKTTPTKKTLDPVAISGEFNQTSKEEISSLHKTLSENSRGHEAQIQNQIKKSQEMKMIDQ
jgi:hypothetical protein